VRTRGTSPAALIAEIGQILSRGDFFRSIGRDERHRDDQNQAEVDSVEMKQRTPNQEK